LIDNEETRRRMTLSKECIREGKECNTI
jgi:hypothetical protein